MNHLAILRRSLAVLVLTGAALAARDDLLVADFEGATYGAWKTTGEAFGPGPARGTLPGQMEVSGFEGRGLVNSFYNGDRSVGTLTSPPFRIERDFLVFLVGGGMHPGETCINLLIGGKVVRTATGPNDKPGGSERLERHSWEVRALAGKDAIIEIVDRATGGWGHINVDHIVQSDRPAGVVQHVRPLVIDRDYLRFRFPARAGKRAQIALFVDGRIARHAAGADRDAPQALTWDVSRLKGAHAELHISEPLGGDLSSPLADSVSLGDRPEGGLIVVDRLYRETYRPQFHFSARTNWLNDPNGLVFFDGEYHLFFQHNPSGIDWGNTTWGHAVSADLLHWRQLEHALFPDELGTMFSGSAVVDQGDTAGFRTGAGKALVAIYTAAGGTNAASQGKPFTQCIAYSNDRGRTWTKYGGNPVLGHIVGGNRDPKVLWHAPAARWIMALYLDGSDFALFASPDLKRWEKLCDVPMPGTDECPDFFELPVEGDARETKWVFWGGNGNYRLCAFDGRRFMPETPPLRSCYGANDYAAQTYSDIPASDGRRIQIAWMRGGRYPGMPFNQQMSFPRVLTLRKTPEGVRLFFEPIGEIAALRTETREWRGLALAPGKNPLAEFQGELWDIEADLEPGSASETGFVVRGARIAYDAEARELRTPGGAAPLAPEDGRIALRLLVDRTSIEVFAGGGLRLICFCFLPDPADRGLELYAKDGGAACRTLRVSALRSAWPE